jgi:hypothetical protein
MAVTTLSQSILQGMDPKTYRSLSDIDAGNELTKAGMDSSPTTGWGAAGRLAQALAGTYLQNSATSDLAKTIAGGKKSAADDLLAAIQASTPASHSGFADTSVSAVPAAKPVLAAPVAPDPGSPNAIVADRFPAEWSPQPTAQPASGGEAVAAINTAIQPRGIRNNNPLNIEDGGFAKSLPGYAGSDGRFAKFETPDHGVAAASKLLDIYDQKHGLNTVAGIVGRWAPTTDGNNVSAYAADVAHRLGVDPNAPISAEQRPQLIAAMGQHENGKPIQVAQAAARTANDATAADKAESPSIDVHRLMAVMQNPYADDMSKQIAGKLILQQLTPKEHEYASSPQGIFDKTTGKLVEGQKAQSTFDGLQGKDLMSAVQKSNPAMASQVTAIIEGRAPYPTGSRLNPVQQQIKELVTQIDPTFEAGNSGARIKVRNEFEAGGPSSPAAAITAGNTAIQHLGHLSDEAEKLGNYDSGIPGNNAANSVKNWLSTSSGGGIAANNFDSIRNKYIEEATKFYRGTGGNEADLQRDIASLNSAQSPSQLRDVIKTQSDLMQSKVNALQERWKHGMGPMVGEFPIIHPESKAAVDRINQRQAGKSASSDDATAPKVPEASAAAPDRSAIEAEMRKRGLLK